MEMSLFANVFKTLFLLAVIVPIKLYCQVECKAALGPHLKPVGDSVVSWAVEGMAAGGIMTNREYANTMFITGLNVSSKDFKHLLYNENTLKYWWNTNSGAVGGNSGDTTAHFQDFADPVKKYIGIRELFYNYKTADFQAKIGVNTYKSPDYFLVDERLLGVSLNKQFGAWKLHSMIGTTHKNMAKMASVCGTKHVYRLIRGNRVDFVGNKLFESNLYLVALTYTPADKKQKEVAASEGEFDEFEGFADVSEKKKLLKSVGLVYNQEFGEIFHDYKYYMGAFATFSLPLNIDWRVEAMYQYISTEKVFVTFSDLIKNFNFTKSSMTVNAGYFHQFGPDEPFYPSFSNLFIGEVVRLDSRETPLVYASARYRLDNKLKPYLRFGSVYQLSGYKTNEMDVEFGLHLFDGMRSYLTFSRIDSGALKEVYYMGRLEFRFTY